MAILKVDPDFSDSDELRGIARERRLWMCVVLRALMDWAQHKHKRPFSKDTFRDGLEKSSRPKLLKWLFKEGSRGRVGSLWWIAEHCTVNAQVFVRCIREVAKGVAEGRVVLGAKIGVSDILGRTERSN